jgi:excisionase family DNA binding protein
MAPSPVKLRHMQTETHPAFLTVTEAARRLGVSTRTAYRLIADEALPAVELRGLMRIPSRALDQWVATQERKAMGEAP